MQLHKINLDLLSKIHKEAQKSPRKRKNYNFHQIEDSAQRFLNAIEPESYVHPHRHINPHRDEGFLVLQGKGIAVSFKETGEILDSFLLDPTQGQLGVDIPGGLYHTIIALEKGTVFYEVKPGPYNPVADKGFAPWAPQENTPDSIQYLNDLKKRLGV